MLHACDLPQYYWGTCLARAKEWFHPVGEGAQSAQYPLVLFFRASLAKKDIIFKTSIAPLSLGLDHSRSERQASKRHKLSRKNKLNGEFISYLACGAVRRLTLDAIGQSQV